MTELEKLKIADGLLTIKKLKGDDFLQNKTNVLASIKDVVPDVEKRTMTLIGTAIDCDVFAVINAANDKNIEASIIAVAKKMEEDYGADYLISLDIVYITDNTALKYFNIFPTKNHVSV